MTRDQSVTPTFAGDGWDGGDVSLPSLERIRSDSEFRSDGDHPHHPHHPIHPIRDRVSDQVTVPADRPSVEHVPERAACNDPEPVAVDPDADLDRASLEGPLPSFVDWVTLTFGLRHPDRKLAELAAGMCDFAGHQYESLDDSETRVHLVLASRPSYLAALDRALDIYAVGQLRRLAIRKLRLVVVSDSNGVRAVEAAQRAGGAEFADCLLDEVLAAIGAEAT